MMKDKRDTQNSKQGNFDQLMAAREELKKLLEDLEKKYQHLNNQNATENQFKVLGSINKTIASINSKLDNFFRLVRRENITQEQKNKLFSTTESEKSALNKMSSLMKDFLPQSVDNLARDNAEIRKAITGANDSKKNLLNSILQSHQSFLKTIKELKTQLQGFTVKWDNFSKQVLNVSPKVEQDKTVTQVENKKRALSWISPAKHESASHLLKKLDNNLHAAIHWNEFGDKYEKKLQEILTSLRKGVSSQSANDSSNRVLLASTLTKLNLVKEEMVKDKGQNFDKEAPESLEKVIKDTLSLSGKVGSKEITNAIDKLPRPVEKLIEEEKPVIGLRISSKG